MVCKGHTQVEGIEFEGISFSIAILEAIRVFLDFPNFKNFKVYYMDVKQTFLNGNLEGEVCIELAKGFILLENKNYVCILKKELYGLKKAPRAWYSRLDKYLHQQGFKRRVASSNIYIKVEKENMIIIMVYVDDIIFGSNTNNLSQRFAKKMQKVICNVHAW